MAKRPAPVLLRQTLERGALMMVGVVFAVVTALLSSGGRMGHAGEDVQQNAPATWEWDGTGSDTTGAVDVATGVYLLAWDAKCPVSVELDRWTGERASLEQPLGTHDHWTFPVLLWQGSYYFWVEGACDWSLRLRLSPT